MRGSLEDHILFVKKKKGKKTASQKIGDVLDGKTCLTSAGHPGPRSLYSTSQDC